MGVTFLANPERLTWDDFIETENLVDPDGRKVSALTDFEWDWPPGPSVKKDGQVAFGDQTLMITPDCKVLKGSVIFKDPKKAATLLAHEQVHYDIIRAIGRVVAVRLAEVRAKNVAGLDAAADLLLDLHFVVRAKLIHRQYDRETNHGAEPNYQAHWSKVVAQTLANPNAFTMAGYWL